MRIRSTVLAVAFATAALVGGAGTALADDPRGEYEHSSPRGEEYDHGSQRGGEYDRGDQRGGDYGTQVEWAYDHEGLGGKYANISGHSGLTQAEGYAYDHEGLGGIWQR
ncbi:hypothetical protein NX801_14630 [Streptomyces sp. LP05-1]|uniref:Secreted protein n=1 Tax=Streptomyces pyxinae TaxID=2970734 RepID=A0ABT2CJI4_9ACTN|nr:hypothetical protein [Streptomyces sp. LP05-1]MCS0636871.1 hypothetical protein [Streptomyces sp. LP05-1]